jgi:hypothetical protein
LNRCIARECGFCARLSKTHKRVDSLIADGRTGSGERREAIPLHLDFMFFYRLLDRRPLLNHTRFYSSLVKTCFLIFPGKFL